MKKVKVFFATIILAFLVIFNLQKTKAYTVSSLELQTQPTYIIADLDPFSYEPSGEIDKDTVAKYSGKISNILFPISIVVTVISLSIIGLKYIIGSVNEKADYKQNLWPILVGVFVISFLTSILSAIAKFAGSI